MNKENRLVKVSHETSLYINPKREIEGVLVEYLNNNFVEHNPVFKQFVKKFNKRIDKNTYTLSKNKETEKYRFGLAQALTSDIYQDANKQGVKLDLDNLIKYALSNS